MSLPGVTFSLLEALVALVYFNVHARGVGVRDPLSMSVRLQHRLSGMRAPSPYGTHIHCLVMLVRSKSRWGKPVWGEGG